MAIPIISVIISTYNRQDKLKFAIQSVIDQSYENWELIIIDDCSTDETEKTVSLFRDPRISYKKRTTNFGSDTQPKNDGIKVAKGQYIAFLDDDNTFRVDHLQVLLNALIKDESLTLVYGDRWAIDQSGTVPPRLGFTAEFIASNLLVRNYIDTSDVLVKREALLEVGGFDERYTKYIDWNLWLRLAKAGYIFKRVPIIITDYYMSSTNKSSTNITKNEALYLKEFGQAKNIPDWKPLDINEPNDFGQFDLTIKLGFLGDIIPPKIAIYTLTHDRLDYTKRTFTSMAKTAGYDYDHYIYDNGSTDGTVEWLKEYEKQNDNVHLILSEDNKGIGLASNVIVDEITKKDYDFIGKVDNDCLFLTDEWLKRMVDIWDANRMIVLSLYVQGLRDNPGGAPRIGFGMIKGEFLGMTKHVGGICHFVSKLGYKDFRWPTDEFLHGMQDLEFSQYLLVNGFQMGYLENYYVEHMDGTEGQQKKYPEYFERRKTEKTSVYDKN